MLLGLFLAAQTGCSALTTLVNTPTPIPSPTWLVVSLPPTPTPARPTPTPTRAPLPTKPTPLPTAVLTPPTPASAPRKAPPTPNGPLARVIVHGNPTTGCAALTFDMGERAAGSTGAVLDALRQYGVHATFLLTGQWAEANPSLVRRMTAEGHELGNHSYDHPNFTEIGEAEMLSQLDRTEAVAQRIAGASTKPYFRPPFGAYDDRVRAALAKHGYHLLYWTLDSADWRSEMAVDDIVNRVANNTRAGDIVVFHGYADKTGRALPTILSRLRSRGVRLCTVTETL